MLELQFVDDSANMFVIFLILGRGPASPLVHPPQLNKMGIIRKLRVSTLRC